MMNSGHHATCEIRQKRPSFGAKKDVSRFEITVGNLRLVHGGKTICQLDKKWPGFIGLTIVGEKNLKIAGAISLNAINHLQPLGH